MEIIKLTELSVYRDGGSLSVSFETKEPGAEFTLHFPILQSPIFSPGTNLYKFKPPILTKTVRTNYSSAITGKKYPDCSSDEIFSDWEKARQILSESRSLVSALNSKYAWVHELMTKVADGNGEYRSEI